MECRKMVDENLLCLKFGKNFGTKFNSALFRQCKSGYQTLSSIECSSKC